MLPPPVQGARIDLGGVACWLGGDGPPLLLVHSVNAAASAAEVRPVFDAMTPRFTVMAMELPGFGSSRRDEGPYTPRRMTDAVLAAAAELRSRCDGMAVAALAASLGCEFLARAALEQPAWFSRLALVSPTGLGGTRPFRGFGGFVGFGGRGAASDRAGPGHLGRAGDAVQAAAATREVPGMHALLRVPLWSDALFRALTRPGVVRYFLERTWGGKSIDEQMWAYAVATAREPGARHAPLAFLSGKLFGADIVRVYEALAQPVWASHGTRGDFVDYRGKVGLLGRANWRFTVYEGGALPYFEHRARFAADLEAFLVGADAPLTAA